MSRARKLLEESQAFRLSVVSEIHREIAEACGKNHPPFLSLDPPDPHIIDTKAIYNGKTPIRRNQYQHGEITLRE